MVCLPDLVAPLVGAWIEISDPFRSRCDPVKSLPSWERGLKYHRSIFKSSSHWSLPSWERGLKSTAAMVHAFDTESLPSWERGLKYLHSFSMDTGSIVAPLVGAWIEITDRQVIFADGYSRSPRGSVD